MADNNGQRPRRRTVPELIEEAKSLTMDSTSALAEITARYERNIRWLALRMINQGVREDLDELVQRGFLGLLLAVRKFKKKSGVQFYTYASPWVKQSMKKRDPLTVSLDTPDTPYGDDEDGLCLLDTIPSKDGNQQKAAEIGEIWRLAKRLPRNQRVILLLRYRQGMTLEEAGAILGITRERVRQLEAKALENMKKMASLPTGQAGGAA